MSQTSLVKQISENVPFVPDFPSPISRFPLGSPPGLSFASKRYGLEYIRRTSNGRTECSTFSIGRYVRGQALREEVAGASVEKRCSITFAISRSTLPVLGIGVGRLFDAGTESDADVDNGIESAPCS